VIENPLKDWGFFKTYKAPDPLSNRISEFQEKIFNWNEAEYELRNQRKERKLIWGNGERLFDRLYFLRGFENLMIDFATDNPNLPKLIEMLYEYEKKLIKKWLDIGVDIIWFHTDIGTQTGLMISPQMFRRYLKDMYKDLFTLCRKKGVHVYLSSDGNIIDIIDDLIDCGISMHDPQTGAIKTEDIKKHYKGKICIYLDIDRQKLPYYKPEEIEKTIINYINELNSEQGGLMFLAGIVDATGPIRNIEVLCETLIKNCF